jgi:hypothetical protein
VDEEEHWPRWLTGFRHAKPLAKNIKRNIAFFRPVFGTPDFASDAACAGVAAPDKSPAPTPSSAVLRTARRARTTLDSFMGLSRMAVAILFGDDLIIKDNLADYWNRVQSTRPTGSVLLGDGQRYAFRGRAALKAMLPALKPEE